MLARSTYEAALQVVSVLGQELDEEVDGVVRARYNRCLDRLFDERRQPQPREQVQRVLCAHALKRVASLWFQPSVCSDALLSFEKLSNAALHGAQLRGRECRRRPAAPGGCRRWGGGGGGGGEEEEQQPAAAGGSG